MLVVVGEEGRLHRPDGPQRRGDVEPTGGLATKSAQNLPRGLCSAMEGALQPVTLPTVPRATHR